MKLLPLNGYCDLWLFYSPVL